MERVGKSKRTKGIVWLLGLLAGGALLSCSGINPATPPAPLAEIPSSVSIPDASIDLQTISSGEGSALKALTAVHVAKALVGPDGEFSRVIAIGPDSISSTNAVLNDTLAIVNLASIPVSPSLFQMEFPIDFRQDGVPERVLKFDFAPFDYDGDGNAESCTGCTCPVGCSPGLDACPSEALASDLRPICFRIWLRRSSDAPFQRLMAGFFDLLPIQDNPATDSNEENPGKGRYTTGSSGSNGESGIGSLFLKLVYDHRDAVSPLHLLTQLAVVMKQVDGMGALLLRSASNSFVEQVAVDGSGDPNRVQKTAKITFEGFEDSPSQEPQSSDSQYIGRYREDLDFWSGSFFAHNPPPEASVEVPTTCARISTGDRVLPELCLDAGIDTSGEAPLAPTPDIAFPTDFPETPAF